MSKRAAAQIAEDLRSHRWFGVQDLAPSAIARARNRWAMLPEDSRASRSSASSTPGPISTSATPTSSDRVRGRETRHPAGRRLSAELPAISLSEPFVKPTTMLYRNFLAMETEELLRCHPIDGAVLMGGCDKTTPGLIMGATHEPAGDLCSGRAMLRGNWHGKTLGCGSDSWKYWAELSAGNITETTGTRWRRHRPLPRHVHDHGHRLTMTASPRRWVSRCPAPRRIPAAGRQSSAPVRGGRDGASSRWCGRT